MWAGVLPVLLPARDGRSLLASKEDRIKVVAHFVVLISAVFRVIETKLAGEVLAEALDITVGEQDTPGYTKNKTFVHSKSGAINPPIRRNERSWSLSDVRSNGVINQPIKSQPAVLICRCPVSFRTSYFLTTCSHLSEQRYARSYICTKYNIHQQQYEVILATPASPWIFFFR